MTYSYPLSMPTLGDGEIEAAMAVLRTGHTTMGERVEEFEERFAQYVNARHAVMVNSGSSADLLMAFAARQMDTHTRRVIIPAVTWPTHVWSWVMAGYSIRFVDVDGLNTTAEILDNAIISRHDMVSLVHLMGLPCDFASLPCRVTEDCCEALGSPVGWMGEMATWSFFFSHQMTTMEGGAITTDDRATADVLRSLRSHGWARHMGQDPYRFIGPGFNVRPTEVAAAIGLVQLNRVDDFNQQRAKNRSVFANLLRDCPGIEIPASPADTSWFGLPFFVDQDRDKLAKFLEDNGVETRPILGGNLLRQPAFKHLADRECPGADRVHDHGLFVGLHPTADSGVDQVAWLIRGHMECR